QQSELRLCGIRAGELDAHRRRVSADGLRVSNVASTRRQFIHVDRSFVHVDGLVRRFPRALYLFASLQGLMLFSPIGANTILVITAVALFWAAMTDLREFKIPNGLIIVLAGLFFVHAAVSGRWASLHWNLALAVSLFCVMLYFYSRNWMGGGDVKML